MKITEAIEKVSDLYPHPYKNCEMVDFCNELGAILCSSYKKNYKTIYVASGELLPEGVKRDNIIRVVQGSRVLVRDDIFVDTDTLYPNSERYITKAGEGNGNLSVTYLVPYSPIRYLRLTGQTLNSCTDGFELNSPCDIRKGDILKIIITGDGNHTFNVSGSEVQQDGTFKVFGNEELTGTASIERIIDDTTVTDAPYDRLYIEFLIARVARYQKDYETENRALANFNSLAEDYKTFLVQHGTQPYPNQFYNWW